MKRIISAILIIVLVISQTACLRTINNSSAEGEVIIPTPNEKAAELTILFDSEGELNLWSDNKAYSNYKIEFEKAYGVKVNLEALSPYNDFAPDFYMKRAEEYDEKLMTKLYLQNGPELIYKRFFIPMESPLIGKTVVNVTDKIKNLDNIYKAFLSDNMYYVPVSMVIPALEMPQKTAVNLGIKEPVISWNKKDYIETRKQWAAASKPLLTFAELSDIIAGYMDGITLFDGNQVKINTPEMKACISEIRKEILSDNYKLHNDYTYKNYYNMIFDNSSQEFKESLLQMRKNENNQECFNKASSRNALNTRFTSDSLNVGNNVTLEPFALAGINTLFNAFMINKKGKNLNLAYEFLNGILSKKTQLDIYQANRMNTYEAFYPVSKEIETEIETLEAKEELNPIAIKLKKEVLSKIKEEKIQVAAFKNEKEKQIFSSWYGDIMQFIFAEKPYSDEELSAALKVLEDNYIIYLK